MVCDGIKLEAQLSHKTSTAQPDYKKTSIRAAQLFHILFWITTFVSHNSNQYKFSAELKNF